jgi:transposase
LSRNAAAERFGIAVADGGALVACWRDTGATAAKPKGGDLRSRRIEMYREVIFDTSKREHMLRAGHFPSHRITSAGLACCFLPL